MRDFAQGSIAGRCDDQAWHDLTLGLRGREVVQVLAGLEPGDTVAAAADGKTTGIEGRRIFVP